MKFYAPKYKQLDLGLLRSSLDELDKTNRWVALGDFLPWTELEKEYNSRLDNQKKGAGNKPARMILGAMIIKHKLNLSDAETIEIIRESPYMQYFCGLHEFTDKPIFDPSLFVTIRKRISEEELNKMTVKLLNKQRRLLEEKRKREEEEAKKNDGEPPTPEPEEPNAASFTDSKGREHKGVLKIDATCADAEMRYPVDVDIIHDGCRKVTDYIMKVCEMFELHKPRTNYKHARQAYLLLVKKAKKKGKMLHNNSHKFESRFLGLTIPTNRSVMFGSLSGSKLGIWVAHGEGKFSLPYDEDKYNVVAKYSYDEYPGNPNGSDYSIAALASADGRHLAIMPHLERSIFPWQNGCYPADRKNNDQVTPWIEAFVNARKWVEAKMK